MAEKIPRRMRRYYRKGEAEQDNSKNVPAREEKKDPFISPTGRRVLMELPTMKYEDLGNATKKSYEELKGIKDKSAAEELALKEIEKFKQKNNRMPNNEEAEQIADNLYSQLKGVDSDELYGIKKPKKEEKTIGGGRAERKRMRSRRGDKEEEKEFGAKESEAASQGKAGAPMTDIKSLFEDESDTQKSKAEEEDFDLGIDGPSAGADAQEDEEKELGEIGELAENDSQKCPNCKKETEKIIYCPKCGAAFCEKCAKKDATGYICPKCGAKIKK